MTVSYNSTQIIPAPFVEIVKNYNVNADGTKVGATYTINVSGKIVSTGTTVEDHFADCLAKKEDLSELFSVDGQSFEIQAKSTQPAIKAYVTVKNLTFQTGEGNNHWINYIPYTITLEADDMFGIEDGYGDSFTHHLVSSEESWAYEQTETPVDADNAHTYRLTHNISAVGQRHYDSPSVVTEAWESAYNWVTTRIGETDGHSSANLYDYSLTTNKDTKNGSYTATETWTDAVDSAIEDFSIEEATDQNTGITTVSINGSITGMEQGSDSKYDNASAKWTTVSGLLYTRANTYSSVTLSTTVESSSVDKNPVTGVINYNYTYSDRPTLCISGARSESIEITDNIETDIFASIFVLGRANGPILQDLDTTTARTRTVAISAVMDKVDSCSATTMIAAAPDVSSLLNDFLSQLTGAGYTNAFKSNDTESWNPKTGSYSRTVTWTATQC